MNSIYEYELDYIENASKYFRFDDLFKNIDEPIFSVSETGAKYRWINNWDKEGLLKTKNEDGKWRKFSLVDYVWLKIVMHLREFNCPFNFIRDLKEVVYEDISFDTMANHEQVKKAVLELAKRAGHPENLINEILQSEEVQNELRKIKVCLLKFVVLDVIILKNYYAFIFNGKGDFLPYKESMLAFYQSLEGFTKFMQSSHISISITEILSKFIIDTPLDIVHKKLALLTDDEAKVIEAVRNEDLKSITIKKSDNNTIDFMFIKDEPKVTKASRLSDMIMRSGYQEIIVKVRNGEVVHCTNERREQFEKKIPDDPA